MQAAQRLYNGEIRADLTLLHGDSWIISAGFVGVRSSWQGFVGWGAQECGAEDLGLMALGAELRGGNASCYFRPWLDEFWSCEQSAYLGREKHSGRHSQIGLVQHHLHLCTPQGCTR